MKIKGMKVKGLKRKKELTKELNIKEITKINTQDIIENSFIKDYIRYKEFLENKGWEREEINLHEDLSAIVTINHLKANNEETVIHIKCPPGTIFSIPGTQSFPYDNEQQNAIIENIRPLEVKFANSNGEEINQDISIKILRNKILKKSEEIYSLSYKDINMLDYSESPNRFKNYTDLFRFKDGMELKGEDSLKIYVVNPNIDIDIIKFNFGIDLWIRKY